MSMELPKDDPNGSKGISGMPEGGTEKSPEDLDSRLIKKLQSLLGEGRQDEAKSVAQDLVRSSIEPGKTSQPSTEKLADLLMDVIAKVDRSSAPESPAAASPRMEPPGKRIGHFRLIQELGSGAQGQVYLAEDTRLSRKVALKVLAAPYIRHGSALKRFQREAAIASRLDHPGICSVYDAGEAEGTHYIAMRYIEGETLSQKISLAKKNAGHGGEQVVDIPPSPDTGLQGKVLEKESSGSEPRSPSSSTRTRGRIFRVVHLIEKAARSLHVAHEAGLIHRDIKPGNLLVTPLGDPVILDFGLAREEESQVESLTQSQGQVGTPVYMSPEQIAGGNRSLDCRTDIYSLGVTLYECLTLQRPFEALTLDALYQNILHADAPDSRSLNPGISRDLKVILETAMERDRDRRYKSALDFAEDLRRARSYEPIQARPAGPLLRFHRWMQRNPVLATATLGLFLILATGLVITLLLLGQVKHQRDLKERALWESLNSQAQASRWSGRAGRRFDSLDAVARAAAIHPSPALRNEAIACMAYRDLQVVGAAGELPSDTLRIAYDEAGKRWARVDAEGNIHVIEEGGNEEFSIPSTGTPKAHHDYHLRFSPDSDLLALRYLTDLQLWDLNSRKSLLKITGGTGYMALEFSPDGRLLASGEKDRCIHLHDLSTLKESRILKPGPSSFSVYSIRFHPSKPFLAACSNTFPVVQVWNLESGEVQEFEHPECVLAIAWRPHSGILAAACANKSIYLWDTGNPVPHEHILQGHTMPIGGVLFDPTGKFLLSTGWDGTIRLWDVFRMTEILSAAGKGGFGEPRWRDNGRFLAFQGPPVADGVWKVSLNREYQSFLDTKTAIKGLDISPDGRFLGAAVGTEVLIWNVEFGAKVAALPITEFTTENMHDSRIVRFLPDGKGLIIRQGLFLCRWPIAAPSRNEELLVGPPEILSTCNKSRLEASLSPDGRHLACIYSYRKAFVLDLASGETNVPVESEENIDFISVSPGNQWIALGYRQKSGIGIFSAQEGTAVQELQTKMTARPLFGPRGKWLVSSEAGENRIWKAGSWRLEKVLPRKGATPGGLAFSGDGALLAVARTDTLVDILETEHFEVLASLEAPDPLQVRSLSFSRDGGRLAAGGDGLCVWDLRSIHRQLADIGLEGSWPPYPAPGREPAKEPVQVHVEYDHSLYLSQNLEILTKTIEKDTDPRETCRLYRYRGIVHRRLNDNQKAVEDFTRAIQLEEDLIPNLYLDRALAKRSLGNYRESLEDLIFLAEKGFKNELVYLNLAEIHVHFQEYEKAIAAYKKALEIHPGHGNAINNLAWLYVKSPPEYRNPQEALSLIEKALERWPGNPFFLNTLGLVYYRLEDFEDSVSALKKAAQADQMEVRASSWLLLSMSYQKLGRKELASEHYRKALGVRQALLDLHLEDLLAESEVLFSSGR